MSYGKIQQNNRQPVKTKLNTKNINNKKKSLHSVLFEICINVLK